MHDEELFVLLIILLSATAFLGWYIYLKTRNKERMALIEKDKDVSEIYAKRKVYIGFPWLKIGIITTGFSIGWIIAVIISELILRKPEGNYTIQPEPVVLGCLFFFTSVSILVAYFADKPKSKE
jgi:hypothetical protein